MNKLNGLLYGIISSASFGLIPLFAIPAMQHGMDFMNVISYRFLFATIALAVLLKIRKVPFCIEKSDLPTLLLLSFFYLISSVFLLWGYKFMPSGVATTIHFMYPVITTLVMMLFFHEKNSLFRTLAILMAIGGVYGICVVSCYGWSAQEPEPERTEAYFLCVSFQYGDIACRNVVNRKFTFYTGFYYCR